jgi:hypothetical protein
MKSFRILNLPVMLLGFGAALILSPACKAQESSPDHFTDTGVQDVYQPAPAKPAAAAKTKAAMTVAQAEKQQGHLAASLQNASTRNSSSAAQPNAVAVADKRKVVARKQEKP